MIIPGITPERTREIFGVPTERARMSIGASDPYVLFLREVRSGKDTRMDLEQALKSWEAVGIGFFTQGIANPTLRDQASRLTKPFPMGGAFTEAVMNAIEHGSDFCQRGDVVIDLESNEKGFLFSVTDPGSGVQAEQIKKSQVNTDTARGNGLVSLKRAPVIVTCENLQEGFRLSILYILQ